MKKHAIFCAYNTKNWLPLKKTRFFIFSRRCIYPAFAFLQTEPTPPPLRKNRLFLNSPFNQELCKAYGLDKTAGKALIEFLAKEIRGNNKNEERLLTKLQGIEEFTGAKNDNKQLPSFLKETARLINKDSLWAANQKTKRFEAMCLAEKIAVLIFRRPRR